MRCACIDVGSNTVRLLVAEPAPGGGLRPVASDRHHTRLRAGRGADEPIGAAKAAEASRVVASQAALAREAGAQRLLVVATASVRGAPDGERLCALLGRAAGCEVRVLSGAEEAAAAFRGATHGAPGAPGDVVAVVDVGGGSTELAVGTTGAGVTWSTSVPLGSRALTDAHVAADPPTPAELELVRARVRDELDALDEPPPPGPPSHAWAVGGSATALGALAGAVLTAETLRAACEALCAQPSDRVAAEHGLHPDRAATLAAGLVVLEQVGALLGADLHLAAGGLREGMILGMLDGDGQGT